MTEPNPIRQRIAHAIHRYDQHHALSGNAIPSSHHYGEADFVLAELRNELDALAALREVARWYCPACGRGDAAPTTEDWEQQKQRADRAEAELRQHTEAESADAAAGSYAGRAETAERERDEARQHAAAIAAQRDRLRQRMNALADRWDGALAVDKPYARTLRNEISVGPFEAEEPTAPAAPVHCPCNGVHFPSQENCRWCKCHRAKQAPAATQATGHEKTTRVFAALHRSAEQDVSRVIALYEGWVKAGPPPLGASMSRWWDRRLAELHRAIQPPVPAATEATDTTKEH